MKLCLAVLPVWFASQMLNVSYITVSLCFVLWYHLISTLLILLQNYPSDWRVIMEHMPDTTSVNKALNSKLNYLCVSRCGKIEIPCTKFWSYILQWGFHPECSDLVDRMIFFPLLWGRVIRRLSASVNSLSHLALIDVQDWNIREQLVDVYCLGNLVVGVLLNLLLKYL